MKTNLSMALLVGALFQTGCTLTWAPPPSEFERWKKPGVSTQYVKAALLECGYPFPDANIDQLIKEWGASWVSSVLLADRCMENQGFVAEQQKDGTTARCKRKLHPESARYNTSEQIQALERACNPSTPVPAPSVEKRLGSPFCKTYPRSNLCQPMVVPDTSFKKSSARPVLVPQYPVIDRVTPQVQKDSNAQMNHLLQGSGSRK
jgi:hypothetical protein